MELVKAFEITICCIFKSTRSNSEKVELYVCALLSSNWTISSNPTFYDHFILVNVYLLLLSSKFHFNVLSVQKHSARTIIHNYLR